MPQWTERRLLILGMTYPHYSYKYVENVCTGALEEGTWRMVRIHPVPARYLEDRPHSFQWIKAKVAPHPGDPRPESYRIDHRSIEVQERIPPKAAEQRRSLIMRSPHICRSVEDLRERWTKDRTSLGIVQPREITRTRLKARPAAERAEWLKKEKELLAQKPLFNRPPKPIDFPEKEFLVSWRCEDERCGGHEMGMNQWPLHELYRKLRGDADRDKKVLDKMNRELDLSKRDVFLFLGSFRDRMWNFGLMDSFSPPKKAQGTLFP